MSKLYSYSTAKFDLKSPGPESVEEYDAKAGKPGQCLADGIDAEIYRGTIPDFWRNFYPEVKKAFGLERRVDEKATAKAKAKAEAGAKVKDVLETFTSFDNYVRATLSPEALTDYVALANEVAGKIEIDPAPSRRASGPGKDYLDKAEAILTRDLDGIEKAVTTCASKVPDFELERDADGKPTQDSLARLIKAWDQARLAEVSL